MKKLFMLSTLMLSVFLCTFAYANREECDQEGIKKYKQNLILPARTGSIYYIENDSQKDIWLNNALKRGGASAGWASQLQANHWSTLMISKDFMLSCASIVKDKMNKLDCADIVKVCRLSTPQNQSGQGSYWLKENQAISRMGE